MSEAPQSPAGAHGHLNAPGLNAPEHAPGPAAPNPLPPLQIPPAANAPLPPAIEIFKAPDLSFLTSTIQPLNKEKGNWVNWSHQMNRIFQILDTQAYIDGHVSLPDPAIYPDAARNWRYNNTFLIMIINNHIIESEQIHTNDCKTAHATWENLRKYHELSSYQIWIDKCRVLELMKAKEGDNIPEHLMKVKKQWETIKLFGKERYHKMFNDTLFKKAIVTSLLRSWDSFCASYIKCFLDNDPESIDARQCIDAQELLGTISQEYTWRYDEERQSYKGDKSCSQNGERPSGNNSNQTSNQGRSARKKHCGQCD